MKHQVLASAFLAAAILAGSACTTPDSGNGKTSSSTTTTSSSSTSTTTTSIDPDELARIEKDVRNYNYVIGTQAFATTYQFTNEPALLEIAGRIKDMGSNMIKFWATDDDKVDQVLSRYDFAHVIMWYRSDGWGFKYGYSAAEAERDYTAIVSYTKKLLTRYNNSGITFYLGHWEGDWYFVDNYDAGQKTVSPVLIQGMIDWYNNRQKAVDDAKAAVEHTNVDVWHYAEINRPTDALVYGYDRVINKVIPFTNVDMISYSAYDSQDYSLENMSTLFRYISERLPAKPSVTGPRIFVGEFSTPAADVSFDKEAHKTRNVASIVKFLNQDARFVLYWQMYDNELDASGRNRGFWLIDNLNVKWPLHATFESALSKAREYVRGYRTRNGKIPSLEEYRRYLLDLPI